MVHFIQLQKFGDYPVRFHEEDSLDVFLAREKLTVPVFMQLNGKGQKLGTVGRTILQFDIVSDERGEFRLYEAFERPVYCVHKNPEANNAFAFVTVCLHPTTTFSSTTGTYPNLRQSFCRKEATGFCRICHPRAHL